MTMYKRVEFGVSLVLSWSCVYNEGAMALVFSSWEDKQRSGVHMAMWHRSYTTQDYLPASLRTGSGMYIAREMRTSKCSLTTDQCWPVMESLSTCPWPRVLDYIRDVGRQNGNCHCLPTLYADMETLLGMLTDIRINPDNKLSGYIRIINYPFNYPSTWRLIIFMYFLCSFSKFLRYFTKKFVH